MSKENKFIDIPEELGSFIKTNKKKLIAKNLVKDVVDFYSNKNFKFLLSKIEEDNEIIKSFEGVDEREEFLNTAIKDSAPLEKLNIFTFLKEIKVQEKAHEYFGILKTEKLLGRFNDLATLLGELLLRVQAVYRKQGILYVYDDKIHQIKITVDDFDKFFQIV